MSGIARRLYRGEVNVDFVGRKKLWYSLSAVLLVISIAGLVINGLNLGVEFKGGSVFSFKAPTADIEQVRATFADAGAHQVIVQTTNNGWRVTTESLAGRAGDRRSRRRSPRSSACRRTRSTSR